MAEAALDLRSLEAVISKLSAEDRGQLVQIAATELAKPFRPNPGPQTAALESKADILLYGGQAGGGKSALEVGCAANNHMSGLILRREASQLDGLIEFSRQILTGHGEFVGGNDNVWRLNNGGRIKFAGLKQPDDWRKHAGNARDYLAFDEAGEFLKEQVFSLIGWLRTTREGQRCRVILGSNPPRGGDGLWMIEEFAPWLDPNYPNRAMPGELRWAIVVASVTEWVDGPGTYERNGETYDAMSRTFIPASLDDNPYVDAGYRGRLQSLPEPLRSQLLYGDFLAGRADDEWQLIPAEWIKQAQARWNSEGFRGFKMTALAVDVAQGGADDSTLAARYGTWFAPLVVKKGVETPDGPSIGAMVFSHRRDGAGVIIDVGGGYGGGAVTFLKDNGVAVAPYNGANGSTARSADGQFHFANKRAEAHWRFREALDPSQEGGSVIALPPDPLLLADLTAVRWKPVGQDKVQIEEKAEIKKRLGRSPDRGDAVIMSWSEGNKLAVRKMQSEALGGRLPQVTLGYAKHKVGRR
ncbi:Terminase-like family protein [Aminobacter sp. MSH1]|uniref:terminase large subunit domain-containing protein n=1 Tax=Aminobacter sp. MSH1 TaxID=374606 RepID=UPI000D3AB40C|nr:terminase family protein [Aminobacter sp. MSH1]AWC21390.1 Terminase-like family protein [Aminobacter sp. MSH1]